ncbi:neutral zinc metallopeptidase [Labedaea rhizosphaerae]|uniref:Putative metalloprotease n=1 Tax=Labedaea rhizosphaerae TaxID=598644 RepID=A0A4R6SD86_LABRH|nr:neutral zinc metallopeptidase [Labedaea rhizosphaerae]TDP97587.1 putative metalloprotease [Labedaea rhizosphaerae]
MRVGAAFVPLTVLLAVLAGCTTVVTGQPRALGQIDPGTVAGLPVTNGPSGPRAGASDARLEVENVASDQQGHAMDLLATNALSDIYQFWTDTLPAQFGGTEFVAPKRLVSYDSRSDSMKICTLDTRGLVNAMYCRMDDSVSWDRGELLPQFANNPNYGPMSVVTVLAHEMGHKVQYLLGAKSGIDDDTPTIVKEQQADCYAGVFIRWVAEDKAPHFQLSTGDGLNKVMSAILSIRDPVGAADANHPQAHGLAFDRIYAFQAGFTDGAQRCAKIDMNDVQGRLTEHKFDQQDFDRGNLRFDERSVGLLQISLDEAFKGVGVPLPKIVPGGSRCPDGKDTPPATYCAANNQVSIDLPRLANLASPPTRGQPLDPNAPGIGDFAAFAEVGSRYALSMEHGRGLPLDGTEPGLRTACLTGAWASFTRHRTQDNPQNQLRLSVGDLDEAVAELLSPHGLIAADASGTQVPAGFARVEAFRVGYTQGSKPCTEQF